MSRMTHIAIIEKYDEHRLEIQSLLSSILTCFADDKLFSQGTEELSEILSSLCLYYPFVSLLYLLDKNGNQITPNLPGNYYKNQSRSGMNADRSKRPYFILAERTEGPVVTEPYLSSVRRELCVSAALKIPGKGQEVLGYVVLDIDLGATLAFLTGETRRIRFEPFFKSMYALIVLGLFTVSGILLYAAVSECTKVITSLLDPELKSIIPFGVVIYLTLALAVFDLGKTTLEEEVLLYKDILRHSSTRRTITRFIAAIIIAVSIEALMLIFKSALDGGSEQIIQAVWIIIAAALLLLSLGVYVFLGSHAEMVLIRGKKMLSSDK